MSAHELTLPVEHPLLHALRIDPDRRVVERVDVAHDAVATLLRSERIDTVEFIAGHCLVIDDGGSTDGDPNRFSFTDGPTRPFFGQALILAVEHGSWTSTTLDPKALRERIVWEVWDRDEERYVAWPIPSSSAGSKLRSRKKDHRLTALK